MRFKFSVYGLKFIIFLIINLMSCGITQASSADTAAIMTKIRKSYELIMKPGEKPEDLNPAIVLGAQAISESRNVGFLRGMGLGYLDLSYAYGEKRDEARKAENLDLSEKIFRQISYWPGLADVLHCRAAAIPYDGGRIMERINKQNEALTYYIKGGDPLKIATAYQELGDLYEIAGDNQSSFKTLNLSLLNYQKAGYHKLQGIYDLLGTAYFSAGNFNEAIRYGLLAVKTGRSLKDSSQQMSTIYNRLGGSYYSMRDFSNAAAYQLQGFALAKKNNDLPSMYVIACNTSLTLCHLQQYAKAIAILRQTEKLMPTNDVSLKASFLSRYLSVYLIEKKLDEAHPIAEKMVLIAGQLPKDDPGKNQVLFTLNNYYFLNKQYDKAQDMLAKYAALPNLSPQAKISIYQNKFMIDSALKNYREAMNDHIRFKAIADSVFDDKKSKQIAQLNIQYETENKNRQLMLQVRQLELQHILLEQSQASKMRYAIMAAVLLLITGLLISRYRLKQRANRELTYEQGVVSRKNEKLQHLLQEKEWLLKEIHHRVKNNLQIIMSLLNSQSSYIEEGAALEAIQESQSRVNSMALIHQKLYRSSTMSSINMKEYISDLVGYFKSTYVLKQHIGFYLDVAPLIIDVAIAVPLSLILNEAVTNCLKYAFPNGRNGEIRIILINTTDDDINLYIADDGIGLPQGFDPEKQSSLGMSLIRGLSEDIDGKYIISGGPQGTSISIAFKSIKLTGMPSFLDDEAIALSSDSAYDTLYK